MCAPKYTHFISYLKDIFDYDWLLVSFRFINCNWKSCKLLEGRRLCPQREHFCSRSVKVDAVLTALARTVLRIVPSSLRCRMEAEELLLVVFWRGCLSTYISMLPFPLGRTLSGWCGSMREWMRGDFRDESGAQKPTPLQRTDTLPQQQTPQLVC